VKAGADPMQDRDLHERIDGRLSPDRAEQVDDYLADHPELEEQWSQYAEQRQALRAAFGAEDAEAIPPRLRVGNILAEHRRRHWQYFGLAAAALLLLVLGGLGGWAARDTFPGLGSSASAMLANGVFDDAIAAYRTFSVETRHPVEVGANEEAHLVQWLSKRVGHRLVAPDLKEIGFRLMGGRLLPADSKPAGWFMYEDGKGTRLSCYFLSADVGGETEFKYREQDGVGAFYWVDDGLAYAIAGNADRDLLLKVADIVYRQSSQDAGKAKPPPLPNKPS
jgi:anti-sigma factor RsiW